MRKPHPNHRALARGVCDSIERAMTGPGLRPPVILRRPVSPTEIVFWCVMAVVVGGFLARCAA